MKGTTYEFVVVKVKKNVCFLTMKSEKFDFIIIIYF